MSLHEYANPRTRGFVVTFVTDRDTARGGSRTFTINDAGDEYDAIRSAADRLQDLINSNNVELLNGWRGWFAKYNRGTMRQVGSARAFKIHNGDIVVSDRGVDYASVVKYGEVPF